jgi:2-furoyl-CoA dehydrogenase large subunit
MRFEAAVTADGIVTGVRVDLTDNVGAYLRPPEPSTLYRCFGNITGAYRIRRCASGPAPWSPTRCRPD